MATIIGGIKDANVIIATFPEYIPETGVVGARGCQ